MPDDGSPLQQRLSDEVVTVATQRVLFRAHDDDELLPGNIEQPVNARLVPRLACDQSILNPAIFIATGIIGPPTKMLASVDILDASQLQSAPERFPVELGIVAAIGAAANIHQHADTVPLDQLYDAFRCDVAVPDSENIQYVAQAFSLK